MFYKISGAVLLIFVMLYLSIYKPWVIKNPNDPHFDSTKFEYQFYGSRESLENAMSVMFKPGMDKSYVDSILLSKPFTGSMKYKKRGNYIIYHGENQYPLRLVWNMNTRVVGVLYSEDDKIIDIFVDVGHSIFNDWNIKDLEKNNDR